MEKNLHVFQVNEGIILDGIKLKGVREFQYVQDEGENIGTLSLKMDVKILNNLDSGQRNGMFKQHGQ